MNRLFYGNFDLEYELAGRRGSLPAAVRRLNVELLPAWIGIATAADAIFSPEPFDEEWESSLSAAGLPVPRVLAEADLAGQSFALVPWGWSRRAVEWAEDRKIAVDCPPIEAVRLANSRAFSLRLEQEWGVGLPGAMAVHSLHELQAALERLPPENERWVLKAEFGMSGRERVRGHGRDLSESAARWVENRFRHQETLVLEPWVERISEVGLQFTVPGTGDVILDGVTSLLTDGAGTYRGSRFDPASECRDHWSGAIETGLRAAERIQSLGYCGPLGIDTVEYRDIDGAGRIRPLQDVNARWTMGRLALGFRKLLHPGESGVWLHQRWPTGDATGTRRWFEDFAASLPAGVRVVRTSPYAIGGRPVGHGTVVLFASEGELQAAILTRAT